MTETCPVSLKPRASATTTLRCDLPAGHEGFHHTAIDKADIPPARCSSRSPMSPGYPSRQCAYLLGSGHGENHLDEYGNEWAPHADILTPEERAEVEEEAASGIYSDEDPTATNEPTALAEADLLDNAARFDTFRAWKLEAERLDRVADNHARVACLHLLSGRPDMALKRALAFEAAQDATRAFLATSWTVGA